jgi:putative component of membrane protein insertase Oxa1/YidC/SpoIIIJ protein YidD
VIEVADKELGCETGWNSQASASAHANHAAAIAAIGIMMTVAVLNACLFQPTASATTIAALATTIPALGVTKTIIQRLFILLFLCSGGRWASFAP